MFSINVIEKLRQFHDIEGEVGDDDYEKILNTLWADEASTEEVDSRFEEGGRWSNYETNIYKIESDGEVVYFELWREVPATEMQEGGDFSYGFYEVVPIEVTVIEYLHKKEAIASN